MRLEKRLLYYSVSTEELVASRVGKQITAFAVILVCSDRSETHAVYSICGDCEKIYLGQRKRQFCTRLKEHQRAVSNSNSSKSALAEHVCESHNIAWDDSRIITTNNRYSQRLRLEAWHINANPCALNIGMMEVIYRKNIYILLVDEVTLTVYKVMIFNIKYP